MKKIYKVEAETLGNKVSDFFATKTAAVEFLNDLYNQIEKSIQAGWVIEKPCKLVGSVEVWKTFFNGPFENIGEIYHRVINVK